MTGIAYAPPQPAASQGHLLDLYVPTEVKRPMSVVIWSGGSGWRAENGRGGAELVAAHLNPAGFAVAGVAICSRFERPERHRGSRGALVAGRSRRRGAAHASELENDYRLI